MSRATTLLAAVLLLAGGCSNGLDGLEGEELFVAACAGCHDRDGSGGIGPAIGHPDARAALELSDAQLRGVIEVGPGRMPAFGRTLTAAQVDSLVRHLRQLQTGE